MVPRIAHQRVAESYKKKPREICPECGKDVHSPDCAYYEKRG